MPKLTDRFLAGLKVENGRKDRLVFDTTCPGLGVRVTAKGTRTLHRAMDRSRDPPQGTRAAWCLG